MSQPKNFAGTAARGPLRGPLAGAVAKIILLSQTSPIVLPGMTLVGRPTWLQTMFGYRSDMVTKICLVTGLSLNSPDQNQKTEIRNMHYKLHNITSKLPLNSLTLPLSHAGHH